MDVTVIKKYRDKNYFQGKTLPNYSYGASGSSPTIGVHNSLTGLQGGSSGEYYHLTSAEYTGTGTGNFVRLDSPVFTTQILSPLIYGSTAANGNIIIRGTSNGTKTTSGIFLQDLGGYVGIGTTTQTNSRILNVASAGIYSAGNLQFAAGMNIFMGATADAGTRFIIKHVSGESPTNVCLDYYEDLRFRSGVASATERVRFTTEGYVGILTSTPLGALCINGGVHIGGDSDAGDNNLFIDGTAQEPNYTSGFQGTNWRIQADGDAEFENMFIRGGLTVSELIINQLHYQNGGLIIGAGAGRIATVVDDTQGAEILTFEDPEGNGVIPFTVGAIVKMQKVDIDRTTVVRVLVRQVSDADASDYTIEFEPTAGWVPGDDDIGVFEIGDEVCAIGHTTDTNLDASIYMSATDVDNPFLRVLDVVDSYADWTTAGASLKLQLGNLASLADYDDGSIVIPSDPGYGLYCDNVYLSGTIIATAGYIGGTGGWAITTGSLIAGTGGTRIELDTTTGLHLGATVFADAPFSVTPAGVLKAISGNIGGWDISAAALYYDGDSDIESAGMAPADFPFYAGADYADRADAPFRVTPSGYLIAKKFIYSYKLSNDVLISHNAAANFPITSYGKIKTIILGDDVQEDLTIRIVHTVDVGADVLTYSRIYRNGGAVGGAHVTYNAAAPDQATYSEDITNWNAGDTIELWGYKYAAGTSYATNFRVLGIHTSISNEVSGTTSTP